MESANIHHQTLKHQLVGSSPSTSLASDSCYGISTNTRDAWNAYSSILNAESLSSHPNNEALLNQRQEENNLCSSSLLSSQSYDTLVMAPNSSFNYDWPNPSFINSQSSDNLHISRIHKEELADNYYLKYTELLMSSTPCSSSNGQESSLIRRANEPRNCDLHLVNDHHHHSNLSTKFLLKSFSSGNLESKTHEGDDLLYCGKGFSQVFPSVPVSSLLLNQEGFSTSQGPSLDMNLEASSSRFDGNYMDPSFENKIGTLRDGFSYGFDHHMHQQSPKVPMHNVTNKVFHGAAAEAKRTSNKIESSKPINQTSGKKPRLEVRSSCPPLKQVRKQKLGDRIAALQQLVSPFGKTDTASVLMEAIGYIKFLQSQVETLSVPYMKSARNKANRLSRKGGPIYKNEEEEGLKIKGDLKSRGLCLVPLSCLSYIADGGGGAAVWPPSRYGGGPTENY